MRRITILLAAVALLVGLSTPATAVGGATLFAEHPSVAAQPEIGRSIGDMAIKDGRLYLGYGNYSANTGPIDIAYVELATGATGVAFEDTPTEEISVYRSFGGNLFAPWVDPMGPGSAVNGGMTSDVGGWHNEFTFPAGHVYDYTELGDSRFLAGAIAYGGAGVWQSDSGGPWRLVLEENSPGGATGWERFYWIATLNGKVYAQAKHNGGTAEMPHSTLFKMHVYDGRSWKTSSAQVDAFEANSIEVFNGRLFYQRGVFDGRRTRSSGAPAFVRDWFNSGSTLYAMGGDGTVARTSNGRTWETLGRVALPDGVSARSVAVDAGWVYVGTSTGAVYRAAL